MSNSYFANDSSVVQSHEIERDQLAVFYGLIGGERSRSQNSELRTQNRL